jgi:hypothetical protein
MIVYIIILLNDNSQIIVFKVWPFTSENHVPKQIQIYKEYYYILNELNN